MADKVKIEAKIIVIHEGRIAFYRGNVPAYRTNKAGQLVKTRPDGKPVLPRYSWTWLLDPSTTQAAATIKEIKEEAARQLDIFFNGRENWPKDNPTTGTKGVIQCFGDGNKLPKVYDGYKDMFWVKVSDTTAPIIGDRRGRQLTWVPIGPLLEGNGEWHYVDSKSGQATEEVPNADVIPYAGSYCRGRISLYPYNNEQAGINANARSAQFLRPGDAFGGGGRRSAAEELAEMAGDVGSPAGAQPDPWD